MELEDLPPGFGEATREIEHDLLEMASRAELMFMRAMDALSKLDQGMAHEVMAADDKVDAIDLRIESRCLELLSASHPEGSDLRVVGAALKMITDIERVGDLAVDIARAAIRIEKELGASDVVDLPRVAEISRSMFHQSIEAYVRQDAAIVEEVITNEEEVDRLFLETRDQIHDLMRRHSDDVVTLSLLLIALHDIERVADHAVNIAERVMFMITGELQPRG
ncbi:MAG: phosphate signaling complex protein PhoU [Chthonomonas sp.]|nr:phosphate signaling complex protein PhoU [Chthonomonas sp.]